MNLAKVNSLVRLILISSSGLATVTAACHFNPVWGALLGIVAGSSLWHRENK